MDWNRREISWSRVRRNHRLVQFPQPPFTNPFPWSARRQRFTPSQRFVALFLYYGVMVSYRSRDLSKIIFLQIIPSTKILKKNAIILILLIKVISLKKKKERKRKRKIERSRFKEKYQKFKKSKKKKKKGYEISRLNFCHNVNKSTIIK